MNKDVKPNASYGEIRRDVDTSGGWEKHRSPEYWDYRKKLEELPRNGITPEFPLCVNIETTNVCNLDCIMCPRTVYLARGTFPRQGMMSFDLYQKIIDEGERYRLPSVKLQYLGEPLLHPDVAKQIRYAKDAGILDVIFNTNATLLTEEKSYEILEAGIDAIFFSVDSADPRTFNEIRIGADYEKVVANIHNFLEIKEKMGYDNVQTRISMTVIKQDLAELGRFKDLWIDKVDAIGFGLYYDVIEDGIKDLPHNDDFACAQLFQRVFIMWDGEVTPCCMDDNRYHVMGNVNNQNLYDIWHGKIANDLRTQHLCGRYGDISICSKCSFPHTELNGDVVAVDHLEKEIKDIDSRQNVRWHLDEATLELSSKAQRRRVKSISKSATTVSES